MRRAILCLILIFALAMSAEAYTYSSGKGGNDRYYQSLIERFPRHRKVIDKLYSGYSGWIIPLADRHGIAPLVALSELGTDRVEVMVPVLYKYSDVFMELYNTLGKAVPREQDRARIALSLLTAFSLGDDDQQMKYHDMLERAKFEDTRASSFRGAEANHYAKRILDSTVMPDNFIDKLKRTPEEYQTLLQELSQTDAEVLAACGHYPNALAFLLNTGKEGLRLIEKTGGQIVMLSWFLPDEEQKKLPAQFRKYANLGEALRYCGADSYFTIMVNPEMFFQLFSRLRGDVAERYLMSYATLFCQTGEGDKEATDFFRGLSREKSRYLANAAAELMNLPDSAEGGDGCVKIGNTTAPLTEPFFFRFVDRYGDLAIDACKNFSSMVDVSRLMMETWRGDEQDVTPVLQAMKDYREMGLQAAFLFRNNTDTQQFLLNYPRVDQRTTLLMFFFYDECFKRHYTENIGDREKQAKAMLDRYEPEHDTGVPVDKEKGLSAVNFIPGYDIVAPLINLVKYGQTPTLGDYFFAAMDLIQIIPIAAAGANVVKGIATGQTKMMLGAARKSIMNSVSSGWRTVKSGTKAAWGAIKNTLDDLMTDGAKAVAKLSMEAVQSPLTDIVQGTRRFVVLVSEFSLPTLDDFAGLAHSIYKRAEALGIWAAKKVWNVISPFDALSEASDLYSGSVKVATEAFVKKNIEEMALQPTVFYMGTNSLLNHLQRRR